MHVMSWGTREVGDTKAGQEKLRLREQELAAKQGNVPSTEAPTGSTHVLEYMCVHVYA